MPDPDRKKGREWDRHKYLRKVKTGYGWRYIYPKDYLAKQRKAASKRWDNAVSNVGRSARDAFLNKNTAQKYSTEDRLMKSVGELVDAGKQWCDLYLNNR